MKQQNTPTPEATPADDCDPYPLKDVLRILAHGVEILLHRKDYDGPDYEEMNICVNRAKEIMARQATPVKREGKEDPISVIYEMLCKIQHPFHEYADNEAARDMALQINHIRGYIVHEVFPATPSQKETSNEVIELLKDFIKSCEHNHLLVNERELFFRAKEIITFEAGESKLKY